MALSARMTPPRYTKLVRSLPATVPFVGPEEQERRRGAPFDARLGANENPFGPSPKAIKAMQDGAADIWKYGDPSSHDLRSALAGQLDVSAENIVVGEGIDGLLGYLVRLLIEPRDAVVTSDGAYPTFNYHVAGYGGVLHKVPYVDDHEDPSALFATAAKVRAKLVYLANPDNPMGTWLKADTITKALDALPDGCLLVLDEAYIEFAPEGTALPTNEIDARIIRMRTFSKAYGMAGARVGYAIADADLIRSFGKVRNHFGMNRAAQAGALAALHDRNWLSETCENVAASRTEITRIAKENNLRCLNSATNFMAIDCGRDGAYARSVLAGLLQRGVFVRMPFVPPQDRCIRISCGREEDLKCLAAALPAALADACAKIDTGKN